MTNIDLAHGRWAERITSGLRHWWPVPAAVATGLIAQRLLLTDRYDVDGHAAEHLASATAPFMAAAVIFILFWATPRAHRQVDLLAAAAGWFVTTLLVMAGNLRVVDDLVTAGYSRTPTDSVPDVADHSLANSSVWWAVLAALLVVVLFRRRRHIGNRAAIGASVSTLIVPPWIIPGAGVIVLAIIRVVQHGREHRPTRIVGPADVTLREGHWPLARRRSPAPR